MEAEQALGRIAQLTDTVAAADEAQQKAFTAEREAEAALVKRAIEIARPALPALAGKIPRKEHTFWPDSVSTATTREWHFERGCLVAGSKAEYDHPRANQGAYAGRALYLLDGGALAQVEWSGSWSKAAGSESTIQGQLNWYLTVDACLNDGWEADDIIAGITERLEAQATGKKAERTKAAIARTTKLRAIVDLTR